MLGFVPADHTPPPGKKPVLLNPEHLDFAWSIASLFAMIRKGAAQFRGAAT